MSSSSHDIIEYHLLTSIEGGCEREAESESERERFYSVFESFEDNAAQE